MLEHLVPNAFAPTVPAIGLDKLKEAGIKGIILDIDNTICPWGEPGLVAGVSEWVNRAKAAGFKLCIVSNGRQKRVQAVARLLDIPAVHGATKPRRPGYLRMLALLGTASSETAAIGDQVFTDVLGGNRMGLYTILVPPVARRELIPTKFMRVLEAWVLARLTRRGIFPGWDRMDQVGCEVPTDQFRR